MDLTLVPFGYSNAEERLVDVHEVASGKRCNCRCPSCQAPLIARKGQRKVWHFAHDSRGSSVHALDRCQYSFYVSARMMARQLMGDSVTLALPGHRISLSEKEPISGEFAGATETVTTKRQVTLTHITLDACIDGHRCDVLGQVNGHPLAFVFEHPERDLSDFLPNAAGGNTGVVGIDLESLKTQLRSHRPEQGSYQERLRAFLFDDHHSKHWLYHPRQDQAIQAAGARLQTTLARVRSRALRERQQDRAFHGDLMEGLQKAMQRNADGQRYRHTCRLCNRSWEGAGARSSECATCGTALLVSSERLGADTERVGSGNT